jgi:hypothetical protein
VPLDPGFHRGSSAYAVATASEPKHVLAVLRVKAADALVSAARKLNRLEGG